MLDFMHLFAMDIAEMIKPVDYKGASINMEFVRIIYLNYSVYELVS